ncbi:MAG: DUF1569 domain-containing protein [Bacteroidota bacterium]
MFLANKLTELKGYMKYRDCVNIEVSKVPVAWHLDHSLRTINEIYKAVKNSDPEQYRSDINLGRSLVLFTNKIPRGKAKAPTIVVPPDTIYTDSLQLHFNEAWTTMKAYDSLPKKAFFTHPYLGFLKKRTAKRFIEIHTEHHLKIIRDILKE